MIAQVVVCVVDEDAKNDAAEQLAAIRMSVGSLRLQQFNQFKIASARLAIGSLGEGHRGDESQTSAVTGAIKSLRHERGVGAVRYPDAAHRRHVDACLCSQAVSH